jgi:hypothetical protein
MYNGNTVTCWETLETPTLHGSSESLSDTIIQKKRGKKREKVRKGTRKNMNNKDKRTI